ncbi:MAG: hypothetical protein KAJ40_08920, partial [Alphaproteobacteria bacterium]|nr:hypothetical protein [Alphaproteobacteria bacterium]
MFEHNKYLKIYTNICQNAVLRTRPTGYCESHHILPKSIYPEFEDVKLHPWNSVYLTAREHFIVHRLLTKCATGDAKQSMIYAAWMMATSGKTRVTARTYAVLKEAASQANKNRIQPMQGKHHSEETKEKIRQGNLGKTVSAETRANIGAASKGRIPSDETRAKISVAQIGDKNHMYGKKASQETKRKQSEAKSGKNNV